MSTVPNFLDFTINAVLYPTFIQELCYKLASIVTFRFRFFYQNCAFFTGWHQSCSVCLIIASKIALFSVSGLKDEKFIKSKPTWKLKHANSILESLEYFCQISSKLILTIVSYTVSKLVHFLRHSVEREETVWHYWYLLLFVLLSHVCVLWCKSILPVIDTWLTVYFTLVKDAVWNEPGGYRGGSPTAVQAWQPCPLWELSPSHSILL